MRVAYDHQIFGIQRYGGVSRYFYELASRLARSIEVDVIAPLYVTAYFGDDSLVPSGRRLGPRWQSPRLRRVVAGVNTLASAVAFRRRREFDVVHETYYARYDTTPSRARRVITIHDMIHEKIPGAFPATDATPEKKARAVRRADHIICVSANTQRDLVEILGVDPRRTTVVHHGPSLTHPCAEARRSDGPPSFLYVGARPSYKNFESVLRAFAASPRLVRDCRLVCFGGGPFTAAELAMARSVGIPHGVLAQVSGSDDVLAALYASALALVYPSTYEGFGMPPLEAMALGCPVLCSATSSMPEVCGDAAAYFAPDSIEDIRRAMELVADSSTHAADLATRGRARAGAFSWDRCAADTLRVYERCMLSA